MVECNVGELIQSYRAENEMSQTDLAKRLQVSITRVIRWEKNRSLPNGKVRFALARLMQVDPNVFKCEKLHRDRCEIAISGERIRTLRKMRGLSQIQLAEALHVGKGTVAMWETGARTPRLPDAFAMSKLFHRRLDYVLGYSIDDSFYDYEKEHLL